MSETKQRILLVEDDEIEVMSLRRELKRAGLAVPVDVACDGIEALEMLGRCQPQDLPALVVLDLNMPRMGGLEFLAEIRQMPVLAHLPVVVLTTSTLESDQRTAGQLGIRAYVVKSAAETGLAAVRGVLSSLGI